MHDANAVRSNLAKLLATEDITVSYKKVETASFNLVSRELILPIWNDVTPEIYDLLVGHEVGHALDTPKSYVDAAKAGGPNFSSFLNVIEDARIERKIKLRYPGLRKPMAIAYRQFMDRDFFKIKGMDVSKFLLIDRINMHFKVGAFCGVSFSNTELPFIKEIEEAETFEQVKDIATRIYAYCEEELKERQEEAAQNLAQMTASSDDSEDDFSSDDGMEQDADQEESPVEDKDPNGFDYGDDEDDLEEDSPSNGTSGGQNDQEIDQYEDEVKSLTAEALENSIKGLAETKNVRVANFPSTEDFALNEIVIPFKELEFFESDFYTSEFYQPGMLAEFETKNKNAISYLVKEFELKKKAAELRRVTVADTGTLNTNKLHSYKFNDDIFRKIGSVAAGKNHGIVLFVDWSGSMQDNIQGTIEQLLTLTTFCRKVNIAFDVYAFTTNYVKPEFIRRLHVPARAKTLELSQFGLMNILSSGMKNQTYKKFANDLLNFAYSLTTHYSPEGIRNRGRDYITEKHHLGGTPLNTTIMVASEVVTAFRTKNKCEVVNVIFLTDGEDNESAWAGTDTGERYGYKIHIQPANYRDVCFIEDKASRKTYRVSEKGVTPTLLTILKDKTKCNLIGFYIVAKRKLSFDAAALRLGVRNLEHAFNAFKSDKFFSITDYGYDEYFLIPGGSDLSTDDDTLEDIVGKEKASARKLKGAFLQMNQNRLLNRVLLSKVIKKVS